MSYQRRTEKHQQISCTAYHTVEVKCARKIEIVRIFLLYEGISETALDEYLQYLDEDKYKTYRAPELRRKQLRKHHLHKELYHLCTETLTESPEQVFDYCFSLHLLRTA